MTETDSFVAELAWSRSVGAGSFSLGKKAGGLVELPADWVPPFIVVRIDDVKRSAVRAGPSLDRPVRLDQNVEDALADLTGTSTELLIRSSVENEDLRARGAFATAEVDSLEEVKAVMGRVAATTISAPEFGDQVGISLIVQQRIRAVRRGHLANTRRVSRDRRGWLLEYERTDVSPALSERIRGVAKTPIRPAILGCTRESEVPRAIRPVAILMAQRNARFHCEWVWDGRRIYIVQADVEVAPRARAPGGTRVIGVGPLDPSRFEILRSGLDTGGDWHKLVAVRKFAALGLPHGEVFALEGDPLIAVAGGDVPAALVRDLAYLTEAPTVIRSDVATSEDSTFLLPRTDGALSPEAASAFIVEKTGDFVRQGIDPIEVAFILHRFIPATASAWSLAAPGHPTVRVDGTWGLPDGLLYFPHDSFEVAEGGRVIGQRLRCKTNVVDFTARGAFIARDAGRPWDWKPSLSDEQLTVIREYSLALANDLRASVETMFFVGVPTHISKSGVLPWFYTTEITEAEPLRRTESHFAAAYFVVRNSADVRHFLAQAADDPGWAQRTALRLDPDLGALRDRAFLDDVADAANETGCHVEFDGSVLSHAYATLQRRGVPVRAVEGAGRGEHLRFNKLVRDFVPEQIERGGERVTAVRLPPPHIERLLLQKLVEEVVEVRLASDSDVRRDELADVIEVVLSLARADGTTLEELLDAVEEKRERRGGFDAGMVLLDTYLPPVTEAAGKAKPGELRRRSPIPDALAEDRPAGLMDPAGDVHLVLPLATAVMGAEEQGYAVDLGSGYVVDVTYFADRVELAIRRGSADEYPGQLQLVFGDPAVS